MRDFFIILVFAFILFGFFRRMMFGSFLAAFERMQNEQDRKDEEERKRKASGKTYLNKSAHSSYIKGEIEDVEYEEIKQS